MRAITLAGAGRAAPRPPPEGTQLELQNAGIVDGVRSAYGRGGRGKVGATPLGEAGAQDGRAPPGRTRAAVPDQLLLGTWQFAQGILEKQQAYRQRGGHFILPAREAKAA